MRFRLAPALMDKRRADASMTYRDFWRRRRRRYWRNLRHGGCYRVDTDLRL